MPRYFSSNPIIVSGIGGSGTRIVAELIRQMGIFIGSELNSSNDNIQLASVFPIMRNMIQRNRGLKGEETMSAGYRGQSSQLKGWGWKLPVSYLIIEYLADIYGKAKFIHVIRHGLDMAYSNNQNQLRNWGPYFGIEADGINDAHASLQYWILANSRVTQFARRSLAPENFLLLNYDALCHDPKSNIQRISEFLDLDISNIDELAGLVKIPVSLGRYKDKDLSVFSLEDFEAVKNLGFEVESLSN